MAIIFTKFSNFFFFLVFIMDTEFFYWKHSSLTKKSEYVQLNWLEQIKVKSWGGFVRLVHQVLISVLEFFPLLTA